MTLTSTWTSPAASVPSTRLRETGLTQEVGDTVTIPTLAHPGPAGADRIVAIATTSQPRLVVVPPGSELLESLVAVTAEFGVDSAQVEILAGTVDRMSWSVPLNCTDGSGRALVYSDRRTARGPVHVIAGSLTLGRRDGEPWFHCHAAWMDPMGTLQAGHVWPGTTVGALGLQTVVYPLPRVHSRNAEDPETGMPVFTPHGGLTDDGPTGRRVVLARALPGQDLQSTARQLCRDLGWERATVRASLGSLVGPAFLRDGYEATLPTPCAELVSLMARVSADGTADTPFQVLVGDTHGGVHGGIIDPSRSPVAVTVELFLTEDPA